MSLALIDYIDRVGDFDDCGLSLQSLVPTGPSQLEMVLKVDWRIEGEPATRWRLTCSGMIEFIVANDAFDSICISGAEDPVARQYIDPRLSVSFTGRPSDVSVLVGRLWLAHVASAGKRIPFGRYFNPLLSLDSLLAGSFGHLAAGPKFLIDGYAQVATECGLSIGITPSPCYKRLVNEEWTPLQAPPCVLTLGDSHFVADAIHSALVPDGGPLT